MLPDYSMIHGGQFGGNLNDGVWCQSANNGSMIGTWYLPNGTQLTTKDTVIFPLFAYHETGQIGLLRDGPIASFPGLYRCVIPDENGTDQTLWVAIYGNGDFNSDSKSV